MIRYLDKNKEVRWELVDAVSSLKEVKGFDVKEFYVNLDKVLTFFSKDKKMFKCVLEFWHSLIYNNIEYNLEFILNTFIDLYKGEIKVEESLEYLSQFIDYDIDCYVIYNCTV